jgi:hypothetical protein
MKFTATASLTAVLATSLALPSLAAPVSPYSTPPASPNAHSINERGEANFTPNSHANVGNKNYGLGRRSSPLAREAARSVSDTSRFRQRSTST